jgi:hypothetical protein
MTQSMSRESNRRPLVRFVQGELMPGVLAVLRLTWFKGRRPGYVEEFAVMESLQGPTVVLAMIEQADQQGYDITVLSTTDTEPFGECYEM